MSNASASAPILFLVAMCAGASSVHAQNWMAISMQGMNQALAQLSPTERALKDKKDFTEADANAAAEYAFNHVQARRFRAGEELIGPAIRSGRLDPERSAIARYVQAKAVEGDFDADPMYRRAVQVYVLGASQRRVSMETLDATIADEIAQDFEAALRGPLPARYRADAAARCRHWAGTAESLAGRAPEIVQGKYKVARNRACSA